MTSDGRELERRIVSRSQELLEPLRKINCFSELLNRRSRDGLDASSQAMLDHITASAARLTLLIEDLLVLVRRFDGADQNE